MYLGKKSLGALQISEKQKGKRLLGSSLQISEKKEKALVLLKYLNV
jgi:hypothetical protein